MCAGGSWESLTEERNCFLHNARTAHDPDAETLAVRRTHASITGCNRSWFVKASPVPFSVKMMSEMKKLRAFTAWVERENVLDRMICEVRDCFYPLSLSFPVFKNGTRAKLCFQRRKTTQPATLAHLHVSSLVKMLNKRLRANEDELRQVESVWPRIERLAYEELERFQHDGDFERSAASWTSLLTVLGVEVDGTTAVERALRSTAFGKLRRLPTRHRDVVHNFDDVEREIRASGDRVLINMLRS